MSPTRGSQPPTTRNRRYLTRPPGLFPRSFRTPDDRSFRARPDWRRRAHHGRSDASGQVGVVGGPPCGTAVRRIVGARHSEYRLLTRARIAAPAGPAVAGACGITPRVGPGTQPRARNPCHRRRRPALNGRGHHEPRTRRTRTRRGCLLVRDFRTLTRWPISWPWCCYVCEAIGQRGARPPAVVVDANGACSASLSEPPQASQLQEQTDRQDPRQQECPERHSGEDLRKGVFGGDPDRRPKSRLQQSRDQPHEAGEDKRLYASEWGERVRCVAVGGVRAR
jgi:hypothetical protein